MEELNNDLSSIILDYFPGGENPSNMSILSNELSSVSEITVSEVVEIKPYPESHTTEIKTLRDKLIENVTILQNELELFESTTRKEVSVKKESLKPVEISDQLTQMQTQVYTMREKLKESEEVIEKKSMENLELRGILQKLENKNSAIGNRCFCFGDCRVF